MPRKTIQKNLAYDSERRLYYATFHRNGRRYTRTFHSEPDALEALEHWMPGPTLFRRCKAAIHWHSG